MLVVRTGRPVISCINKIKNEMKINIYLPRIEMTLILFPDFFVIRLLDSFSHSWSVFHSKHVSFERTRFVKQYNMTKSAEGNSVAPHSVIIISVRVINSRINICVVQKISSLT